MVKNSHMRAGAATQPPPTIWQGHWGWGPLGMASSELENAVNSEHEYNPLPHPGKGPRGMAPREPKNAVKDDNQPHMAGGPCSAPPTGVFPGRVAALLGFNPPPHTSRSQQYHHIAVYRRPVLCAMKLQNTICRLIGAGASRMVSKEFENAAKQSRTEALPTHREPHTTHRESPAMGRGL